MEVVAPISAPMLQMVPMPAAELWDQTAPRCWFAEQLASDSGPPMQDCTPPRGLFHALGLCAARLGMRAVHQHLLNLATSGLLQDLPVHEMLSTPGPKYSTMAPVPPLTVRMPATFKMTSLGEVHLFILPVSLTPMTCEGGQGKILVGWARAWVAADVGWVGYAGKMQATKPTGQDSEGVRGKEMASKPAAVLCCHCKVPVIVSFAASLRADKLSHTGKPCVAGG